ncbi:hypothetical protein A8709_18830 [Paenibacillus pectinilyticus]|uniref:Uncharacterized protein n=1 Tax=Paenibacillus pectinilyticus TaxID=512399 RepID=A0A1C0ZZT5_9BACL|nr:hypothetical protein [Paenibacillus pectinilyticus]OCT13644.1 hypothetical protein A8709_18830 [Paenibacillus pectinilyticus]
MKKLFTSRMNWHARIEQLDTYWEAKLLTWKKRLNPLTNKMGYGIYFYKHMTLNLNRLNKEILQIAEDWMLLSNKKKSPIPSFISVVDGIHASTMFMKLPTYVTEQITSLVSALPGFKELQAISQSYGYKCELHYNQGKAFFGSLQIHFIQINKHTTSLA